MPRKRVRMGFLLHAGCYHRACMFSRISGSSAILFAKTWKEECTRVVRTCNVGIQVLLQVPAYPSFWNRPPTSPRMRKTTLLFHRMRLTRTVWKKYLREKSLAKYASHLSSAYIKRPKICHDDAFLRCICHTPYIKRIFAATKICHDEAFLRWRTVLCFLFLRPSGAGGWLRCGCVV